MLTNVASSGFLVTWLECGINCLVAGKVHLMIQILKPHYDRDVF